MRLLLSIAIIMLTFAPNSHADRSEIEYLLTAVAESDCEFWRNGKKHSAGKASRHLRMKYNRTRKHIKTAEDFIAKLASRSSMSGKPYRFSCSDGTNGLTSTWFREKLAERRSNLVLR